MQRLLGRGVLQAKLTINQPGDVYEQEADRMADTLMRLPEPSTAAAPTAMRESSAPARVQRACACGGTCDDGQKQAPVVQRATATSSSAVATAPPIVHDVLRSPGRPLDSGTRSFMEPRFGADFSDVRVHTDSRAAESARSVGALAYTVGNSLIFANDHYAPQTHSGRKLVAHELTHVLQQRTAGTSGADVQRACNPKAIGHPQCSEVDLSHEFVDGLLFEFKINCDDFAGSAEQQLSALGKSLRPESKVAIHGYASTDGPKDFNEDLACARALKAREMLTSAGFPETSLTKVVSHGPTAGPAAQRRSVTIVVTAPSPSPSPGEETGEPRKAPSTVDIKTTKSGEEPPVGPGKLPTTTTTPVANENKTPDHSSTVTTPSPPSHLIELSGEANITIKHLFVGSPDPKLSAFCRNTEIEGKLQAKLKLDGIGVGDRVHLLYHEPTFSMSFFPFQCGKAPNEKLELDILNVEIFPKILELSLKPGLTLEDELKPGVSLEAEWKPWGKNNNFLSHIKIGGGLEMKYETDPTTMKRTTTLEGSLGVGVEY